MVRAIISLHKSLLDRFGIGLSLLCLIHCISLPLVYLFFPTFDLHENAELTHIFIGIPVIVLAVLAFNRGYKVHGNVIPVVLGLVGSALLLTAFLLHEHTSLLMNLASPHALLTSTGSLSLVLGHLINMKSCPCGSHSCTASSDELNVQMKSTRVQSS